MYMRYSELLASQPVTLDGENYRVVRVAYHKTPESYSVQVALPTELYTIYTQVRSYNCQGNNTHLYGDGAVVDEQQWYVCQ